MQKIECTALPVALLQHELIPGLWLNENQTFLSVKRIEDLPGVVPAEIKTKLNRGIHEVESLSVPELIEDRTGKPFFVYTLENIIMLNSNFEKTLVDAALLAANPKMYLYAEKGPLLVEHDEGYYLIAPVTLKVKKESYVSFI